MQSGLHENSGTACGVRVSHSCILCSSRHFFSTMCNLCCCMPIGWLLPLHDIKMFVLLAVFVQTPKPNNQASPSPYHSPPSPNAPIPSPLSRTPASKQAAPPQNAHVEQQRLSHEQVGTQSCRLLLLLPRQPGLDPCQEIYCGLVSRFVL